MFEGDSKGNAFAAGIVSRSERTIDADEASIGGSTAATLKARIDAVLAARNRPTYKWALLTLGANDVLALPGEAAWNSDLGYTLDAIHAWMPNGKVGIAIPWRRGYGAECDILAERIRSVMVTRPWVFEGPDERVYLENGDDGATYTYDGIHGTPSGYALAADLWWDSMQRVIW